MTPVLRHFDEILLPFALLDLFKAIGDKYFGMTATQQAVYKQKEEQSRLPEMRVMTVVKAVTNPWTLGWQYVANFKPDTRILFIRHPAHVVKALKITPENEKMMSKKLRQLDHAFAARERLFNETFLYEELVVRFISQKNSCFHQIVICFEI